MKPGQYSLKRGCAWLLAGCMSLLCVALLGCSSGEEKSAGARSLTGTSEGSFAEAREATAAARKAAGEATAAPLEGAAPSPAIVFLGTSLTAGYGLEESQAFPALIQEKIRAAGLPYRVTNAGVSGDTSAGGLRRLDWLLKLPISVLVLELGANDMLRGQSPEQLSKNLRAILDQTAAAHPKARFVLAGMRAAPNLGQTYAEAFDAIYPQLAAEYDAALVPFLLEDVAARRNLNQADGIHPTVEGHALIAERVWKTLEPVLTDSVR